MSPIYWQKFISVRIFQCVCCCFVLLVHDLGVLTFSCIVGEDGASSGLFALSVFPRASVGTLRPGGPGA